MSKLRLIAILLALFWVLAKIGLDLAHVGGSGAFAAGDGLVPLFAVLGLAAAAMIGLNTAAGGILAVGMLAWAAFAMGFDLSLGDGLGGLGFGSGGGLIALLVTGGIVAVLASGVASKLWWLAIPAALVLLTQARDASLSLNPGGALTTIVVVSAITLGGLALASGSLTSRSDWRQAAHERMRAELSAQTLADARRRADDDKS